MSLNLPNSLEKKAHGVVFPPAFGAYLLKEWVKFHQTCSQQLILITEITLFPMSVLSGGRLYSRMWKQ